MSISSAYLYEIEIRYKEIRQQIYNYAKNNKEEIKEFFLENDKDDIIENKKIDAYIENIKEDKFKGGIIEIGKICKII